MSRSPLVVVDLALRVWIRRRGVVALGPDLHRQGASRVRVGLEAGQGTSEVVAGYPAELVSCMCVHIDTLDAREEPPATSGVEVLAFREQPAYDRPRV